jgi:hypothetical protein
MVNPVSSSHADYASQFSQPAARPQQSQKSESAQDDKVTLKSAGDVDHDGDSK